ncbi:MAG: aldo/keto reductase [Acidobacteriota bacterium]|nr:aldo/keto reductase [Acidobacteriota bacterium]
MIYGSIPGVGKPVSRIIFGAAHLKQRREAEDFRLCDAFFEGGGNAFDTAHVYGQGDSERTLGRWIRQRGLRERVVIVDKGAHPDVHSEGERQRLDPNSIDSDLVESLERLGTEYIDLFLLHRDDPQQDVASILECLNEQVEKGRIRAFGVSNWSVPRLREANAYAQRRGLLPLAASSSHFSLAEQVRPPWPGSVTLTGAERQEDRDWYTAQATSPQPMALLCWSALAGGWLLRPADAPPPVGTHEEIATRAYESAPNRERRRRLVQLAEERGRSVAQIALAYVLSQPMAPFALISVATQEECADNLAACEVSLSPKELEWLDLRRVGGG